MKEKNQEEQQEEKKIDEAEFDEIEFSSTSEIIVKKSHKKFVYFSWITIVSFIIWANFAQIDQVVKATGNVVPSDENQIIQHYEGGIVTDIFVEEGDLVKKDDLLMIVNNSFSQAELKKATLELKSEEAKYVRLKAEANGLEELIFEKSDDDEVNSINENEIKLFNQRKLLHIDTKNILQEELIKANLSLKDFKSQKINKGKEYTLLKEKFKNLKELEKIGAISRNEIITIESELQKMQSTIDALSFRIPSTEAEINLAKSRLNEIDSKRKAEASEELNKVQLAIENIKSSIHAMKERSSRSEIRAKSEGVIKTIFITTEGGVVRPGGELMELVKLNDSIKIEAKLLPKDRAKIYNKLPALVKVSAYEYTKHGALKAQVKDISPDAFKEERGDVYFLVRLETEKNNLGADKPVVPGMIAEVDIITGKKSILDYILRPLNKASKEAFRI